nr:MAG TPA: AbrB family transcriptional regulator-like protein [Caudoviricetes sp.]
MEEEILKALFRIEEKLDKQNFITNEKGAIRKCDSLGRITLPIATRRDLDIDEDTPLKIVCAGGKIIIEKVEQ